VPPEGWTTPGAYEVRSDLYQVGLVLFEMANGALPYIGEAYFDRQSRHELREFAAASNGIFSSVDRQRIANRAIARAADGNGVVEFGKKQHHALKSLMRIIKRTTAPDPSQGYGAISEMIGELEALRIPDWTPSGCGDKFVPSQWNEWDWRVEKCDKKPEVWVVKRSRKTSSCPNAKSCTANRRANRIANGEIFVKNSLLASALRP